MKIRIENFGPLKKFEFDLSKSFIVTYGNNNIGKSYAMQMVYLLLKTFINFRGIPTIYIGDSSYYHRSGVVNSSTNNISMLVKEFVESGEQEKNVTNDVTGVLFKVLSDAIMPEFMSSCNNTFGNFERTLEKEPHIYLEFAEYVLNIDMKRSEISGDVKLFPIHLKKTENSMHGSRKCKNYLDVYVYNNQDRRPISIIYDQLNKVYFKLLYDIAEDYEQVYFLPASRSGIYSGMNAFGAIVAELSKNRAILTRKIELPGISEPISDYFISLSNIANVYNSRIKGSGYLQGCYNKIEDNILRGKVQFDKSKNALVYVPNDLDASFEMTEVSSMVSEVSPIVAFLKYIIMTRRIRNSKKKFILFIEEPEAHLHPNNQIELIEIFSELASSGLTLIVSSHSNYVFNKLNNLVLAKKLDYNIYQPIYLKQGDDGSESKLLPIDECGADDENFVDVSEKLYNEREEIIQNLNMDEE